MNERINTEKPAAAFHLPRWNELPDIGLYMDQVITLINKYIERLSPCGDGTLTPSMINNYVKLGIIPCPVKKKYSRVQLSRLIMICVMKPVLPIQSIGADRYAAPHTDGGTAAGFLFRALRADISADKRYAPHHHVRRQPKRN